jgi:hypothetical protein
MEERGGGGENDEHSGNISFVIDYLLPDNALNV